MTQPGGILISCGNTFHVGGLAYEIVHLPYLVHSYSTIYLDVKKTEKYSIREETGKMKT